MHVAPVQPAGLVTFYHGTDLPSAARLLGGAILDATAAAALKLDGPPGLFLASELADAEFFAARRGRGAVLVYQMSSAAVGQLQADGADRRPIPRGSKSAVFRGDEFYVPPRAFDLFNRLRASGEIVVAPAP
jgi:hypothetical protein